MDVEDYIKGMRARLKKNVEEVEKAEKLSRTEEARHVVARGLLLDTMNDLEDIIAAWKDNAPARRATEIAIREGSV
jgi:hypothetical protein